MHADRFSAGLRRVFVLPGLLLLLFAACNEQTGTEQQAASSAAGGSTAKPAAARPRVTVDAGPAPTAATIAYTGNFRGFQKPCGCAIQQSGGLFRVSTAIRHFQERIGKGTGETPLDAGGNPLYELPAGLALPQPLWYVECGNFSDPLALYPAERSRTYLKTLEHLIPYGFKAAVPGSSELQLTAEQAADGFAGTTVPIVSCNLSCAPEVLAVKPYLQLAEGWYLTGVSSWSPATIEMPAERWWELANPVESVRAVIAELPPSAHIVVVAIYQPGEVMRELAALPVSVLIGHGSELDKQWGGELAMGVANPPAKGIALRLVSLADEPAADTAPVQPWQVLLTEGWADDEAVVALVDAEKDAIRAKLHARMQAGGEGWKDFDWGNAEKYLPDKEARWQLYADSPPAYVGARECRNCHPLSYELWEDSRHSLALISLVDHGEDETLDCLACHVAGLLQPSGFSPFSPEERVSGVTCENCHGPGSVHVGAMSLRLEVDDIAIERSTLDDCLSCHDPYNSPDYDAAEYWEKIKHQERRLGDRE